MPNSDQTPGDADRSSHGDGLESLNVLSSLNDQVFASAEPPVMFVRRVRRRRWARRALVAAPIATVLVVAALGAWFARDVEPVHHPRSTNRIEAAQSPEQRGANPRGLNNEHDPLDYPPIVVSYATLSSMNRTRSSDTLWLGPNSGGGTSDILTPADARDERRWMQ